MHLNSSGSSVAVMGNKLESVRGHLITHGDVAGGHVLTKDSSKICARESLCRCNWVVVVGAGTGGSCTAGNENGDVGMLSFGGATTLASSTEKVLSVESCLG